MRLTAGQIQAIKQTVQASLGLPAQVRLFGSRLDDEAKGGDVDLHVSVAQPVNVWATAQCASRLERSLDGRKVDVRMWAHGQPVFPSTVLRSPKALCFEPNPTLIASVCTLMTLRGWRTRSCFERSHLLTQARPRFGAAAT